MMLTLIMQNYEYTTMFFVMNIRHRITQNSLLIHTMYAIKTIIGYILFFKILPEIWRDS